MTSLLVRNDEPHGTRFPDTRMVTKTKTSVSQSARSKTKIKIMASVLDYFTKYPRRFRKGRGLQFQNQYVLLTRLLLSVQDMIIPFVKQETRVFKQVTACFTVVVPVVLDGQ